MFWGFRKAREAKELCKYAGLLHQLSSCGKKGTQVLRGESGNLCFTWLEALKMVGNFHSNPIVSFQEIVQQKEPVPNRSVLPLGHCLWITQRSQSDSETLVALQTLLPLLEGLVQMCFLLGSGCPAAIFKQLPFSLPLLLVCSSWRAWRMTSDIRWSWRVVGFLLAKLASHLPGRHHDK